MGEVSHEVDTAEESSTKKPERRLIWRSKRLEELLDFESQKYGLKLNFIGEPSFRAWLLLALPFYAWAAKKRLPLWRWLVLIVPHLSLLAGEMYNTAHEETIRFHGKTDEHFDKAMSSASVGVGVKAVIALLCALYALFGRDPWQPSTRRSRYRKAGRMRDLLENLPAPIGIVAIFGLAFILFRGDPKPTLVQQIRDRDKKVVDLRPRPRGAPSFDRHHDYDPRPGA